MVIDLTQLKTGKTGLIVEMRGGDCFVTKVQRMGIRPGKKIKKVSSHFWRGPQTVEVDRVRFSLGFGMARKVLVEVER